MRYAKITNGVVSQYPVSGTDIRLQNPGTSFPAGVLSQTTMAAFDCLPVTELPAPAYDPKTHRLVELNPAFIEDAWTQVWSVVELTAEELAQVQAQQKQQVEAQRAEAYRTESDPLFFKSQRGEADHQEWLDKVAEIKARYPDS